MTEQDAADEVEHCEVCKGPVQIQIFKGTGICCILCGKVLSGDLTPEQADIIRANGRLV